MMDHTGIIEAESKRLYDNRNYVLHKLDDRHFNELNWNGHVCGLNGYCLDALDESPAGGMQCAATNDAERRRGRGSRGYQLFTVRGMSAAELEDRARLADRLIAEILAEEANKKTMQA